MSLGWMALAVVCLIAGFVWWDGHPRAMDVRLDRDRIPADGRSVATVSGGELTVMNTRHGGVSVEGRTIRAGVMPEQVRLRVDAPGYRAAILHLTTTLDAGDSAGDGTPDFLRLDDPRDEEAFRAWFVWLAEAEYFQAGVAHRPEIDDCAALIRYAYREALKAHDSAWANSAQLPEFPSFDSPAKYHYPFTPLGAALFRVKPGAFRPTDLTDGAFLQFADAQTLCRLNTHPVGRDLSRARPGDLLFFRRGSTFHGMIYVGESKVRPDGHKYLLYHTGPTGKNPGELRRPGVEELMRFPQPEFRPVAANPAFLGVARWNILRGGANE